MASQHPLKTLVWIDASHVRRVLINEVFKSAGLEAFTFESPAELSSEVLNSLTPSLIVMHSDFESSFESEVFAKYEEILISVGEPVLAYECLKLPVQPLKIVNKLKEFL